MNDVQLARAALSIKQSRAMIDACAALRVVTSEREVRAAAAIRVSFALIARAR